MEAIGKIIATEKQPSTIEEFTFWTRKDLKLKPFDVVVVDHVMDAQGNPTKTYKREVVRMLRKAVENGNNPNIVISHMASVQRKAIGQPQPTISWRPHFCRINWRRLIRY